MTWSKSHAWERSEMGFEPRLPGSILGCHTSSHCLKEVGSPTQVGRYLLAQLTWMEEVALDCRSPISYGKDSRQPGEVPIPLGLSRVTWVGRHYFVM